MHPARHQHDPSRTKPERGSDDIQQCNDIVMFHGICRPDAIVGGLPNFEATSENRSRNVVRDHMRKTCRVNDREHVVCAVDPIRNKARVREHEDVILRIRNDCDLVTRHLDHSQTLESDERLRHCR